MIWHIVQRGLLVKRCRVKVVMVSHQQRQGCQIFNGAYCLGRHTPSWIISTQLCTSEKNDEIASAQSAWARCKATSISPSFVCLPVLQAPDRTSCTRPVPFQGLSQLQLLSTVHHSTSACTPRQSDDMEVAWLARAFWRNPGNPRQF